MNKWSRELRRRRAQAAACYGQLRINGYGERQATRLGEKRAGAHGGSDEVDDEVGEAETAANRRVRLPTTEEEEDEAAGDAGRPSARGQGGAKQWTMAELSDEVGR